MFTTFKWNKLFLDASYRSLGMEHLNLPQRIYESFSKNGKELGLTPHETASLLFFCLPFQSQASFGRNKILGDWLEAGKVRLEVISTIQNGLKGKQHDDWVSDNELLNTLTDLKRTQRMN